MSHYPSSDDAKRADNEVIKAILTGSTPKLDETIAELRDEKIPQAATFLCGEQAIKTVMLLANDLGAKNVTLLKYANSGDVSDERSRVVGYSTIAFSADSSSGGKEDRSAAADGSLNQDDQKTLLKLARQTVVTHVKTGRAPSFENPSQALTKPMGAFVTLKKKGNLRGCIGNFQPDIPLYKVVIEMAIAAAAQDPRFRPVTENELNDLSVEISVLSPLRRVRTGMKSGGKTWGAGRERFSCGVRFFRRWPPKTNGTLKPSWASSANKGGLPRDAWKNPSTELYTFTAQVFGEKESK